jgi:nicotinamidase-related amidase
MVSSSIPDDIVAQSAQFVEVLAAWERALPALSWHDVMAGVQPEQVALFSVDMLNGFCYEGALASPRIQHIIPAVVATFRDAYAAGVRDFILAQDAHSADATEFADFAPHCQAGSREAQTVPELAALPFADLYTLVSTHSLSAFQGTHLGDWLEARHDLRVAVIVGNCTDLCVQQMAMHLKLYANAYDRPLRVIMPENAVQTYDMPLATAQELNVLPHNGAVLHLLSLYHMRLNGIEVVRALH